ncbi:hypothetical protein HDK64DRAFT_128285 [Phyllosticta capitalensis]
MRRQHRSSCSRSSRSSSSARVGLCCTTSTPARRGFCSYRALLLRRGVAPAASTMCSSTRGFEDGKMERSNGGREGKKLWSRDQCGLREPWAEGRAWTASKTCKNWSGRLSGSLPAEEEDEGQRRPSLTPSSCLRWANCPGTRETPWPKSTPTSPSLRSRCAQSLHAMFSLWCEDTAKLISLFCAPGSRRRNQRPRPFPPRLPDPALLAPGSRLARRIAASAAGMACCVEARVAAELHGAPLLLSPERDIDTACPPLRLCRPKPAMYPFVTRGPVENAGSRRRQFSSRSAPPQRLGASGIRVRGGCRVHCFCGGQRACKGPARGEGKVGPGEARRKRRCK